MEFFINEIIENEEIRHLLRTDPEGLSQQAKAMAEEMIATGKYKSPSNGMLPLFVLGYLADHTLEVNGARGIPREITVTTLKDANIWVQNHYDRFGTPGLLEFGWMALHAQGDLFRLGRLQFRAVKTDRAHVGEWVLETHIPQGEPLDEQACLDSFAMAEEFFPKYFPEAKAECFDCCSWLLSPNLAYVMGDHSNVVKFMRMWKIKKIIYTQSEGTIGRVFGFGSTRDQLPDLPENTSMQRKVKAFLLAGGDLSDAYGIRMIGQN